MGIICDLTFESGLNSDRQVTSRFEPSQRRVDARETPAAALPPGWATQRNRAPRILISRPAGPGRAARLACVLLC